MPITIEAKTVDELHKIMGDLFGEAPTVSIAGLDPKWDIRTCDLTTLAEIASQRFAAEGWAFSVSENTKAKSALKEQLEQSLEAEAGERKEVEAEAARNDKSPEKRKVGRPAKNSSPAAEAKTNGHATEETPEARKDRCIKRMMDLYAENEEGQKAVKMILAEYGGGARKFTEIEVGQFAAIEKELEKLSG